MAALTRLRRRESGQAVIEMALTLPLLLVIVFGIFDFGFMFQRYEVVTNAAREGARLAVLPDYQDLNGKTQARDRALAYLAAGGINGTPVLVVPPAQCPALAPNQMCASVSATQSVVISGTPSVTVSQVTVEVHFEHPHVFVGPILQLFGGTMGTATLRAVSSMRIE